MPFAKYLCNYAGLSFDLQFTHHTHLLALLLTFSGVSKLILLLSSISMDEAVITEDNPTHLYSDYG